MADEYVEEFDSRDLAQMRKKIASWFRNAQRDLPWRVERNAYRVWVSEIMLQQTTVQAVVPYFERFMQQFPTVETLAQSEEADVLRLWEGLGYYSRARNLRAGAIQVCEQFNGQVPKQVDELLGIKGIGRYTAGAIASFAYNQPAPILEANTLRLFARLLAYDGDPKSAAGQRQLWALAEMFASCRNPAKVNEALMELGALVCRVSAPQCDACPLKRSCRAFLSGRQEELPVLQKRVAITRVVDACVAILRKNKWLVRQRTSEERWAGMWDFPRFRVESVDYDGKLTPATSKRFHEEVRQTLLRDWNVIAEMHDDLLEVRHTVTRYRIRLLALVANWQEGKPLDGEIRWVTAEQLAELPLSVTARRVADWLHEQHTS
ncbi:MAG: A/G-specific adenine glycosylase [Planctomycetaceae bacterium]|nr:A/G-specific adenine glycosylase [Planctomycetaceae bacterium]